LEFLAREIMQEDKIKGMPIGNEVVKLNYPYLHLR
jgi:hypothetical protein